MDKIASLNGDLMDSKIKLDQYHPLDFLIIYPLITFLSFLVTTPLILIQCSIFKISDSIFNNYFLLVDATFIYLFIFLLFRREVFDKTTSKIINVVILWTSTFKLVLIINPPLLFVFSYKKIRSFLSAYF